MIILKGLSIENTEEGRYDEKYYQDVATFSSYEQLARHLLDNLNDEGTLDTENYYYDIRENTI